jgi:hypothetical protein
MKTFVRDADRVNQLFLASRRFPRDPRDSVPCPPGLIRGIRVPSFGLIRAIRVPSPGLIRVDPRPIDP